MQLLRTQWELLTLNRVPLFGKELSMDGSSYITWDYDQAQAQEVGNKAAKIGELKKKGMKVPNGFAITKKAFLDFLIENGIYSKIEALLAELPDDAHSLGNLIPCQALTATPFEKRGINEISQKLTQFFIDTKLSHKMANEITDACNCLADMDKENTLFAVRSSSIREDLDYASFAGLYDTFLNQSLEDIHEAVKRCWQSAFGLRALVYLKKLNLKIKNPTDIAMGVLIQKMIEPAFSGVMFTVNPTTGDASKILIEYMSGLGNLVVSGEVTPNSLLIDKITNQVDMDTVRDILEEGYIYQLTALAKKIEKVFGSYQDIEWAIDKDLQGVVILQARSETVWNIKHQKPFHQPSQTILNFIPEIKV